MRAPSVGSRWRGVPAATSSLCATLMVLLLLPAACGRTPIDVQEQASLVDPWVYALGLCSLKCFRLEECGVATQSKVQCEDACIEEALFTPDDGCWSEWIEARRCRVRYAECRDVEDEELGAGLAGLCSERQAELDVCEG